MTSEARTGTGSRSGPASSPSSTSPDRTRQPHRIASESKCYSCGCEAFGNTICLECKQSGSGGGAKRFTASHWDRAPMSTKLQRCKEMYGYNWGGTE